MKTFNGLLAGLLSVMAGLLLLPALSEAHGTHITCSKANRISANLGRTQPLHVFGTCIEPTNISISDTRVNITIEGSGSGVCGDKLNAKITSADPGARAIIDVRGRNISVTGVEVYSSAIQAGPGCISGLTNDPDCNNSAGIRVQRGGSLLVGRLIENGAGDAYTEVSGVCFRDLPRAGVEVTQGSIARVINSEVTNVGGDGMTVSEGSLATIGFSSGGQFGLTTDAFPGPGAGGPNYIHNNTGGGIVGDRNSNVRIVGNFIFGNGGDGVRIRRNSNADLADNRIDANGANGLRVDDQSSVALAVTFASGCSAGSAGVICGTGTFALSALANTTHAANSTWGVRCTNNSTVTGTNSLTMTRGGVAPIGGVTGLTGGAGLATFASVGTSCIAQGT